MALSVKIIKNNTNITLTTITIDKMLFDVNSDLYVNNKCVFLIITTGWEANGDLFPISLQIAVTPVDQG